MIRVERRERLEERGIGARLKELVDPAFKQQNRYQAASILFEGWDAILPEEVSAITGIDGDKFIYSDNKLPGSLTIEFIPPEDFSWEHLATLLEAFSKKRASGIDPSAFEHRPRFGPSRYYFGDWKV